MIVMQLNLRRLGIIIKKTKEHRIHEKWAKNKNPNCIVFLNNLFCQNILSVKRITTL
jgi:hypothetical protein